MIAFHVDRSQRLKLFQSVNAHSTFMCAPPRIQEYIDMCQIKSISHFGIRNISGIFGMEQGYLSREDCIDALIERDFEKVRQERYPFRPSRFECVFASASLSDLRQFWSELITPTARIYKINSMYDAFSADASLLKAYSIATGGKLSEDTPGYKEICKYWEGVFSPSPRPELLVPLPIFVQEEYTGFLHPTGAL